MPITKEEYLRQRKIKIAIAVAKQNQKARLKIRKRRRSQTHCSICGKLLSIGRRKFYKYCSEKCMIEGNIRYEKTNKRRKMHHEAMEKYRIMYPKRIKAQQLVKKLPLAKLCETCPEDDKRKATIHHHPDYDEPIVFVSVCRLCHTWIHRWEVDNTSDNIPA